MNIPNIKVNEYKIQVIYNHLFSDFKVTVELKVTYDRFSLL